MTKDIDWTPEKIDRLKELYLDKDDLSYTLIAERMTKEFGATFSRSCISGKLSRMRMPLRGPRERVPIIKHSRKKNTWSRPARVPSRRVASCIHENGFDLLELEYGDCKWPEGNAVPYTFCGKPTVDEGSPYCAGHADIAYVKNRKTFA